MEMNYIVTDSAFHISYISYIDAYVAAVVRGLGGSSSVCEKDERAAIKITLPDECAQYFKQTLLRAVGDVIAIGYKWEYFKKNVKTSGLNDDEYGFLLCALIAADYADDCAYCERNVAGEPYSVDGCFNFTMQPLRDKWAEVASCIPQTFIKGQLRDFIAYLVNERKGKRAYLSKEGVFDESFQRLRRASLTGESEREVVRELILSCAGEVELDRPLSEKDEEYLKEYFGEKIFFGKGYFR